MPVSRRAIPAWCPPSTARAAAALIRAPIRHPLADDGFAGGVFLGWRHRVNDARFGIEVGAELADVDWVHDADHTVSVKRSDLYSI
jgi:hypothetical protein